MVGSAAARDRSAGLVIEDNAAMDGRHRTPWPDRPRSSLPSVAWWTGQGNCFEAHCASLKTWTTLPRSQHPGSPPARYRLTPSSPPDHRYRARHLTCADGARAGLSRFFLCSSFDSATPRRGSRLHRMCRSGRDRMRWSLPGIRARCRMSLPRIHGATSFSRTRACGVVVHALCLSFALFAASKKPGTGPGSGYCSGAVLRRSDQKLRRGPTRNDLSFSATRASAARPKFCVNLYWPETPSDALRST